MTVEAPDTIRRGEQVGLRLDIFNNWDRDLEVISSALLELGTVLSLLNGMFKTRRQYRRVSFYVIK